MPRGYVIATHGWIERASGSKANWTAAPAGVTMYSYVAHQVTLDGLRANRIVKNLINGKLTDRRTETPRRIPDYTFGGAADVVAEGWEMEPGIYRVADRPSEVYRGYGTPRPFKAVAAADRFTLSSLFNVRSPWFLPDLGQLYMVTCKEVVVDGLKI